MQNPNASSPVIEPHCLATTIGSLPHTDVKHGTALMFENTREIPSWVQFPKRTFYESMMVQFTEGMPGLVEDGDHFYFDTAIGLDPAHPAAKLAIVGLHPYRTEI